MTRTNTPPTVDGTTTRITAKRCCNGCGRELGDVHPEEVEAAISGARLPDVREECGCPAVVEQIAQVAQRRDAHSNGTWPDGLLHPTWEEIGEPGQDAYRRDAEWALRAVVASGWGPVAQ